MKKNSKALQTAIGAVIVIISGVFGYLQGSGNLIHNDSSETVVQTEVQQTTQKSTKPEIHTQAEITEQTSENYSQTEYFETSSEIFQQQPSDLFQDDDSYVEYHFRNSKLLNQHFQKHGSEFADDFAYGSAEEYEKGASDVINNHNALYKTEKEDGDGVYYIESTNEFVILSTDGYIRTYFRPDKGIDYFNRQ